MAILKPISEIRALIVDDTPVILTMLSAMLNGLGIQKVVTASTKEAALEQFPRLNSCPFDIVFLDRYLSHQSGLDILQLIRPHFQDLPIVMLTQEDEGSKVIEAINLGASDYIVKPFTEDIVVKKLEQAFGRRIR